MSIGNHTVTVKRLPGRDALIGLLVLLILISVVAWLWWKRRGVEAVAVIRVSRPEISEGELARLDWPIEKKTQAALIKSPFVIRAALRQPGMSQLPETAGQSDPVQAIQDRLRVVTEDDSEVLYVLLKGRKPEVTKRLLDAIVDAYMREEVIPGATIAEADKLKRLREHLNQAQAELREQLKKISDLEHAGQSNRPAKMDEIEMTSLRRQQAQAEERLLTIELQLAASPAPAAAPSPPDSLRAQRDFLQQRLQQLQQAIREQIERVDNLPDTSVDLRLLQAEVRWRERRMEETWTEIEELQEKLERQLKVTVLQKATVDES